MHSSFLTPTVAAWRCSLPSEICAQSESHLRKTPTLNFIIIIITDALDRVKANALVKICDLDCLILKLNVTVHALIRLHALPNGRYWLTVKQSFKVTKGHPLLCRSTQHMLSSRAKNGTDSSTFVEHVNENKNKISKTMDAGSKYSYSSDKRKTYHRDVDLLCCISTGRVGSLGWLGLTFDRLQMVWIEPKQMHPISIDDLSLKATATV